MPNSPSPQVPADLTSRKTQTPLCRGFRQRTIATGPRRLAFAGVLLSLTWLAVAAPRTWAQGTKADYERVAKMGEVTRGKVTRGQVAPQWIGEAGNFWYRVELGEGRHEFILVEAVQAKRGPAFDHAKLAATLKEKLGRDVAPDQLPFAALNFTADGNGILFKIDAQVWKLDRASGAVEKSSEAFRDVEVGPRRPNRRGGSGPRPNGTPRRDQSPNDRFVVFARDHNLVARDNSKNEEFKLTSDGAANDYYESGVFWSPDGNYCVALRTVPAQEHKVHLVESSPSDQLQPKLHTLDYLKPGDRIAITKPRLFHLPSRKEIPLKDELFPNPWSIDNLRWSADSKRFTFIYNQRGHQVLRIVVVSAETGEAAKLVSDESATFVDYAHKQFCHWTPDGNELVWMSERDGWNHLYLFDARTGGLKNQITKGSWIVRSVDRVDDEKRQIWFQASGVYPEQDPYYVHFARVNFDGTGLTLLTSGNGTHAIDYSPNREFLIDSYSRVDQPPVSELRRASDGALVCELERGDWSALIATGWKVPERFVAKGRDGQTDIFGVIFRPTNFDPTKKYPVIENIYAGPQGSFAPKRFSSLYPHQVLAELGFIVVQLDGMGTSNRSKAFHDVCWKNLGDSGFPDRMLWLKAAAAKYPYLDLSRVGIYGGSAGGQSALRALLAHGDFYHVAVADCGCHDNRMDKIWWNELWMSYPIGPHYAEQSNVTQAHRLQGKLLLTLGELDRNVDPASTMQVVNALIKANKDFEFILFPGGGHGSGESPYGARRRQDFFVRHLLGVEPRRE